MIWILGSLNINRQVQKDGMKDLAKKIYHEIAEESKV